MRNIRCRGEHNILRKRHLQSWAAYLRSTHSFGAGKDEARHVTRDVNQGMLPMEASALNNYMGDEWGRRLNYMLLRAMCIYHERGIWINLPSILVTYYNMAA